MKMTKEVHKTGRSKDMVRGLSWFLVGNSANKESLPLAMGTFLKAGSNAQEGRCVPDICLPGFDQERLKRARERGSTGFFYVANMSESGPSISRKVTLAAHAQKQTPVFFQLTFNVQVDKYTKGSAMDWDQLTYLQAYHLYKDHLSAIWSRVAQSEAPGRDDLLRYSHLQEALADNPLLAITTLWEVFPTLQAITWDLPIDAIPRVRGLAVRNADALDKATVLAPGFGNLPGEWKLCDQADISGWPS
ncbi:hypothetical protein [Acidithiobacillus albertensis]|uniref:hypothetical protein n=1 Tax=Acidithiobacillus albertensis TaxID=119978 RepID=UPI001C0750BA|nr:hypothetical protein [Acidithiobacillus albertensis]MBU2741470.1 hypothetical protein [Acidithiobacillus albertensis]